jgi:hypothetical protein
MQCQNCFHRHSVDGRREGFSVCRIDPPQGKAHREWPPRVKADDGCSRWFPDDGTFVNEDVILRKIASGVDLMARTLRATAQEERTSRLVDALQQSTDMLGQIRALFAIAMTWPGGPWTRDENLDAFDLATSESDKGRPVRFFAVRTPSPLGSIILCSTSASRERAWDLALAAKQHLEPPSEKHSVGEMIREGYSLVLLEAQTVGINDESDTEEPK